jgi:glycosyltransferase involved in cell wall biosynthesis
MGAQISVGPSALASPRRIAIVLPSLNSGGAERVLLDLAAEFLERGYAVDLVLMATFPDQPLMKLIPPKVRTVDLKRRRLWTSTPALGRYFKEVRPDGVIAAMPLANAISAYARLTSRVSLRLVLSEHNAMSLAFGDVDKTRYLALVPFLRYAYRFGDCVVAVSAGVAERVRRLPGVRTDRVRVIYNPTYSPRIDELSAAPMPHPWFNDFSIPVILGSGRLELQKDFATLLRAVAMLRKRRPARLMILGEGSQRASLIELARELDMQDSMVLVGFVTNPWAYMSRAKVFALSSIHEGLPGVLIEAMACGTPVVSTDCPAGPAEILEGGRYGRLVPTRNAAELAEALADALDQPVAARILKGRAHFFSMGNSVSGYLNALGFSS